MPAILRPNSTLSETVSQGNSAPSWNTSIRSGPVPDVLLMDEPFAALDAQTRDLLLGEMQEIWQRTKKTVLFVTHNVAEAAVLASRVVVFSNRPSTVRAELPVSLPRPRTPEGEGAAAVQRAILAELRPRARGRPGEKGGGGGGGGGAAPP